MRPSIRTAGPYFYTILFLGSVLIWAVPFLYLSIALNSGLLHLPSLPEYLYTALVGFLPGVMEDVLRRGPSLGRPIPWLNLIAVFVASYGLYKPLEVGLGSERRGFLQGYAFALVLMPIATLLVLVSFSLSVLSEGWLGRAAALIATMAVAALVLCVVPKRPVISDRLSIVLAVGFALECVKYLTLAASGTAPAYLEKPLLVALSFLACAAVFIGARALGSVEKPIIGALAGVWLLLVWWNLPARAETPVFTAAQTVAHAAETHAFSPTSFAEYWGADLQPVLRVASGDTIRTKTVDTAGRDEKGQIVARPMNPLTGPFFVEGAMPGDTLSIELVSIRLNRDTAGTGNRFPMEVVTRDYLKGSTFEPGTGIWWKLDRAAGVASLENPSEHLKNFRVPLRPMVGCLGVAPAGRMKFRPDWQGEWGGNMDYNELGEGTTIYFPVFHPGALVFIGDAHAAQGAGEVLGTGLETSLDVEFKVQVIKAQVIKGRPSRMPRAENRDYIMAMGIDDSMPNALQHATSSLANWLESDYHLNSTESAFVLGSAVEYDVAAVAVPRFNVVAKIKKSLLAGLVH